MAKEPQKMRLSEVPVKGMFKVAGPLSMPMMIVQNRAYGLTVVLEEGGDLRLTSYNKDLYDPEVDYYGQGKALINIVPD